MRINVNAMEQRTQADIRVHYQQHLVYAAPDSAFHPEYWTKVRRDAEKLRISPERYRSMAGARIIDYAWRMCAEQSFVLIEYGQLRQAAMTAKIWSVLQPERPLPCIQVARAFAAQSKKKEMIEYLKMAVERGLKEKAAVRLDPAFKAYTGDSDFKKVLE